jgi:membrane protease YdiL (CAAX protease family)
MSLSLELFEENPFCRIKVRHILICWLLSVVALSMQMAVFYMMNGDVPKKPEPVFLLFLGSLAIAFTIAWTIRQLKLAQIRLKPLIGDFSSPIRWTSIVSVIVARIAFSIGFFYVCYYIVSFFFPAWVERMISESFLADAGESAYPIVYYFLMILYRLLLSPITEAFIIQGVILHRWSAKWGNRTAVIIISLIYTMNANVLGGLSSGLMQTLIYIKSKSLFVSVVARIINNLLGLLIFFITLPLENNLEQFRSHVGIGIVCLATSTPFLVWVLYKNWIRPQEQLPYFANINSSNV